MDPNLGQNIEYLYYHPRKFFCAPFQSVTPPLSEDNHGIALCWDDTNELIYKTETDSQT